MNKDFITITGIRFYDGEELFRVDKIFVVKKILTILMMMKL